MNRIFAIGDVHGCATELERLLDQLNPGESDRFIFLGDLINRGPDSHQVLELVESLENTDCLLGNHELRLLKYHESQDATLLKAYDTETVEQMTADNWAFLQSFQKTLLLEEWDTLLVHGGFEPNSPWQEQPLEVITEIQAVDLSTQQWGRRSDFPKGQPWSYFWLGPPYVIYGHTPRKTVFRTPWTLGIDTACVYGGHLTAYEITQKTFHQVPALNQYI